MPRNDILNNEPESGQPEQARPGYAPGRFGHEPAPPALPRFVGEPATARKAADVPDEHRKLLTQMHDVVARMGEVCPASRAGKSAIFINQHLKNLAALHDMLVHCGARCPSAAEDGEDKEKEKVRTAALRCAFAAPNFAR